MHRVSKSAVALLSAVAAVGCERPETDTSAAAVAECVPGGRLAASLYGGLEGELDWQGGELACEGMRRPRDQGARLRFEGPAPGTGEAARLAFIIALPTLAEGRTAEELPAGITLIAVDEGRFFSSPEQAGCWADVARHEPLAAGDWRVSGIAYCVSPLAEVNGGASISLRDLHFTGRVDWSEPE